MEKRRTGGRWEIAEIGSKIKGGEGFMHSSAPSVTAKASNTFFETPPKTLGNETQTFFVKFSHTIDTFLCSKKAMDHWLGIAPKKRPISSGSRWAQGPKITFPAVSFLLPCRNAQASMTTSSSSAFSLLLSIFRLSEVTG
jgi:hypothetical protein